MKAKKFVCSGARLYPYLSSLFGLPQKLMLNFLEKTSPVTAGHVAMA